MAKKHQTWLHADLPPSIKHKKYLQGIVNMAQVSAKPANTIKAPKAHYYNYRKIFKGDKIEILHYGDSLKNIGYRRTWTPTRKEGRTMANEQNAKRARKAIYDIVEMNKTPYTKMITLTYKANMQDYDQLAHDFLMFRRALKRKGVEFPYLYVVEKQKRGALHIHCIAFTDDYIDHKLLKKCWRHGFIKINAQFQEIDHKGSYIAKYVQKETMPADKKAYRTSRKIKRPTSKVGLGTTANATRASLGRGFREKQRDTIILSWHGAFVDKDTGEIKQPLKERRATVIKMEKRGGKNK